MATRVKDVEKVISQLAPTADGIAQQLRKRGIKGYRYDLASCPLAEHFGSRLDTVVEVSDSLLVGDEVEFDLPKGALEFVQRFDDGKYPYLDAALHFANRRDRD